MSDGTEVTQLAALSKKIDDQERFTRSIMVVCTVSVLALMFYTLTATYSNLPSTMVFYFMGNLEKIVTEWNLIPDGPPPQH
jgi:hypothetical protein